MGELSQGGGSTGGFDAAERNSRELSTWHAPSAPMDAMLAFGEKQVLDDRGRDMMLNNGYVNGAIGVNRDSIVGSQYRLNSMPDLLAIGIKDEDWSEEFQTLAERRFNLVGESPRAYFDAAGMNTFTSLVRLAVCIYMYTGEVLATAEWSREMKNRPFKTMIQMISPSRLSNPDGMSDSHNLRSGVETDRLGKPTGYWIRDGEPFDYFNPVTTWKRVEPMTKWGRQMVIHIMEQRTPHQPRGISEMVSVLKQLKMTSKFQDVVLQQAVLQASYAASIESELSREIVAEQMGQGDSATDAAKSFLAAYAEYAGKRDIELDGVRVPVLFPGTKLQLRQLQQPAGVGSSYEESLLRHISAGLGMSFEQFSRDYSKTNYSSARAAMNESRKSMASRKKLVSDRFASSVYRLWLEEEFNRGTLPLPKGKDLNWLYSNPMHFDALAACSWIGASGGQIDELKETQSAILRINAGFSTLEQEAANLGRDWRDVAVQRAREVKYLEGLGVMTSGDITKPNGKQTHDDIKDANNGTKDDEEDSNTNDA